MIEFEKFYFEKFSFDKKSRKASFLYSFDENEFFEEIIDFDIDLEINNKIDKNILNNFLFNIFLALGISYYKLFPTKDLIIKSGFLSEKQIRFWKKFYINGLGEFLIKNNIQIDGLFNFINKDKLPNINYVDLNNETNLNNEKSLLLWGGGKDSIVSYNILQSIEKDIFVVGKLDRIKKDTINITKKTPILVKRQLSQNLFKLNNAGYYNGHVPITGMIAFLSLFFAYLYNYKYIILSNEKSSSEENIIWNSLKINHQYSKSSEFEKDFSNYVGEFISKKIKYFSILRGMYEYKIASIFSKQKEFFKYFSSCNNNFKINSSIKLKSNWCCNCEKCCFVFLILSNFLNISELKNIFGENLFENKKLVNTFTSLIGYGKNKPYECVGTYDESLFSIYKAIKKYKDNEFYILIIIEKILKKENKKFDLIKIENKLSKIYDDDIIPKEIYNNLKFS